MLVPWPVVHWRNSCVDHTLVPLLGVHSKSKTGERYYYLDHILLSHGSQSSPPVIN